MIGDALLEYLPAVDSIAELVGERVYQGTAPPSSTYPLIQFFQVAGRRLPVLDGPHGLKVDTIQLDIYTVQRPNADLNDLTHIREAKQVALVIEDAMENFRGVIAGLDVGNCHLESERELLDGPLARVSQDYEIYWRRSEPTP